MTKPPALMRKLSGASDTVPKQSNASDDAAPGSEPPPAAEDKQDAPKPWEAPAWRAHCAQEREAARQVKPYESDLVESVAARYGCVASGEERTAPERSDEDMWHATTDSLSSLKKACMEYGISASGSKESLAARVYHPDQPDPLPKKRRRQAEILERRRQSSAGE